MECILGLLCVTGLIDPCSCMCITCTYWVITDEPISEKGSPPAPKLMDTTTTENDTDK